MLDRRVDVGDVSPDDAKAVVDALNCGAQVGRQREREREGANLSGLTSSSTHRAFNVILMMAFVPPGEMSFKAFIISA